MKRVTSKSLILKYIFRNAPVSRATIAQATEITPATVTMVVAALKEDGVVLETGGEEREKDSDESTVGRKRVAIDIQPSRAYVVGAEFTEKAVVSCLTDLRGRIVGRRILDASGIGAGEMTEAVLTQVSALVKDYPDIARHICGVGLAVPGKIDGATGRLVTNNRAWDGFDLTAITSNLGEHVACENNARAMAYGQYLFRPQRFPESFAYFHVGLGMHCANMMDGELFLGNNYLAGEIGHTIVEPGGKRCECGKYGCLQTYASERWLVKMARLFYEEGVDPLLASLAPSADAINIDVLTRAYSLGDAVIGGYLSKALRYLGISVSNVAITLNPEKICLHGQMFNNSDVRLELTDYIQRQLLFVGSGLADNIEILPYCIEDGALGAAALAVNRFFIEK